ATLTGVAVFSGRGASGGAYADFQSANGDAIEWTVVAGQSGTHELSIAYALGASAPRPVRVTVNGAEMPLAFPPTGSWLTWTTVGRFVSLFEGDNTVRVEAIGSSGANFDYLEVAFDDTPRGQTYRFNFSDGGTPAPSGWIADEGGAFGIGRGPFGLDYGWRDPTAGTPVSLSAYGRNRDPTPDADVFRETLVHMDHPSPGAPAGLFELDLPNGRYRVWIQAGDAADEGTGGARHVVEVEGETVVDLPVGSGAASSRAGSTVVEVGDGSLTVRQGPLGDNTKLQTLVVEPEGRLATPGVLGTTPADGETEVSTQVSLSANSLHLPNLNQAGLSSLDNATITTQTVRLVDAATGGVIPSSVNGTGGGDAINLTPGSPLSANTRYRFLIDGVKDLAGMPLQPFSMEFSTGAGTTPGGGALSSVAFQNAGPVATGAGYTTLTIGPDGKLYGLAVGGEIHRWPIASGGTLGPQEVLTGLTSARGSRLAIGLAFDPNASASNLVAYVSHSSLAFSGAPAWDGNISRLSGANLQNETLLVTRLPRSIRDHVTNSVAFRPGEANALYFLVGSNSAGGAPDSAWGNRPERLLSAALLRLDLSRLPATLPLDAETSMSQSVINAASPSSPTLSDGTYNPYATNAPLQLYATGIRNAYDLVWHSNGQAYVPTNGTAGGSQSPASAAGTRRPDGSFYSGPSIPAIGPNEVQRDWLFRIDPNRALAYYGHPNPLRGEYVLNRGSVDAARYPAGTAPDANYAGAAFDFEFNKSPNGVIEYRSNAHGGALRGALLVCRYSGGSDVIALLPDGPSGDVSTSRVGIAGLTGFRDPLDITEDVSTGNLYVSDFATQEIILLRPTTPSG
ncbi:MAG: Ig-like domain-containing protein, partial [Myxococcota bacterium]